MVAIFWVDCIKKCEAVQTVHISRIEGRGHSITKRMRDAFQSCTYSFRFYHPKINQTGWCAVCIGIGIFLWFICVPIWQTNRCSNWAQNPNCESRCVHAKLGLCTSYRYAEIYNWCHTIVYRWIIELSLLVCVCVLVRLLFLIFALKLHRSLHWHIVVELSIATFSTWNIYCRFSNWSHFLVDSQYGASMKSRVVCVVANNNIQSILFLMSAHKSNRFWIHVQSSLARSLTQRIDIQPKMPLKIIRTKKVLNKFKTAHSIYVRQLTKQTVRGSNQTDL